MDADRPGRTLVTLCGDTDAEGFRQAARALVSLGIAPDRVRFAVKQSGEADLFDPDTAGRLDATQAGAPPLRVPAFFGELADDVVLHADPQRFSLLYALVWRLQHEPGLRHDPLDAQMQLAQRMSHAVRHDIHKMKAYVRFRPIERGPDEPTLHAAWFEPQHHVVDAVAPFFARRFANMRWAILTPRRSVQWDGEQLRFGAGARRQDAPSADAGEALWLTYYEHVFNPARLKLAAMRREMPRRYWHNLPEAQLIAPLAAKAQERTGRMIEQAATEPARRIREVVRPVEAIVAAGADPMHSLRDAAERCRRCPIGAMATQCVWGEGPATARLMLVGEQPGDQEDLTGRPFVGPAGQLLDSALHELGWPRDAIYLTNAVKHFKHELRGTRRIHKTPAQQDAAACLEWLESEIAVVRPEAIVALGATAARSLLRRDVAVMRERGLWHGRADGIQVLVTLHPSALLRMPAHEQRDARARWLADLRLAAAHAPSASA